MLFSPSDAGPRAGTREPQEWRDLTSGGCGRGSSSGRGSSQENAAGRGTSIVSGSEGMAPHRSRDRGPPLIAYTILDTLKKTDAEAAPSARGLAQEPRAPPRRRRSKPRPRPLRTRARLRRRAPPAPSTVAPRPQRPKPRPQQPKPRPWRTALRAAPPGPRLLRPTETGLLRSPGTPAASALDQAVGPASAPQALSTALGSFRRSTSMLQPPGAGLSQPPGTGLFRWSPVPKGLLQPPRTGPLQPPGARLSQPSGTGLFDGVSLSVLGGRGAASSAPGSMMPAQAVGRS